jgi:integrase/recombinase XerD
LKWSGSLHRVKQLREPQFIPATFTTSQVKLLVSFKPQTFIECRTHLLCLILLDTGCRISSALGLRVKDCDMDELLVLYAGKGRKQYRVPFSFELRRHLFRYVREQEKKPHDLLLSAKDGAKLGRCVVLRQVKRLCLRFGFDPPSRTLHSFRATFATSYIRTGGNAAMLQRLLAHSNITTTMRYVNIQTADLSAAHQRHSLLAA